MRPDELLHFVELDEFQDDWEELGLNVEFDLWELQNQIMHDPSGAPIIRGTGGLRKMRFAPSRWRLGKSGAIRVCYVFFQQHWTVMLVMAYDKTRKDNLSASEKQAIAKYIGTVERWFDSRKGNS